MKYTTTAERSTSSAFVAPRTVTGSNASYSLKAAESVARCPHSGKGTARLLEASRGLSCVISALYRLGKNRSRPNGKHHKLEAVESITNCHRKKASQTSGHGEHRAATHSLPLSGQHSLHLPSFHGEHHKLAGTVSITRRGAQLASQTTGRGRHHKRPRASEHHKLSVTSLHHLRPARVEVKNPGRIGPLNNPYSPVGNPGIGNHQDRLFDKGC